MILVGNDTFVPVAAAEFSHKVDSCRSANDRFNCEKVKDEPTAHITFWWHF